MMSQMAGDLPPRTNVLGVGVHPINMEQAVDAIRGWIRRGEKHYVCLAPIHNILACQDDTDLKSLFNHSGLTTPDGMPLVWICRARGYKQAGRVYGPDLMAAVCQSTAASGERHFLLGGHPGVSERVRTALQADYPDLNIVGTFSPPFGPGDPDSEEQTLVAINGVSPDIVWVALGSPRQERWMADHLDEIDAHALIGVGAAFDFLSGRKRQAPRWIQRSGFEWLFRLVNEPRRLWRRYLRYPLFAVLFAAQLLGLKRYDLPTEPAAAPEVPEPPSTRRPGEAPSPRPLDQVPTAKIFGVQISALNVAELHQIVAIAVQTNTKALLPNVNAHGLNLAYNAPWLRDFLNQSTAVFPDGSGALFAARIQGGRFEERVTYADWMWELAGFCAGRGFSLYFLGGHEGVAAQAAANLSQRYPRLQVLGTHHGYFDKTIGSIENETVLAEINRLRPDVVVVGLGMPLQEHWFMENWNRLDVHVGLTAGAAFDYVSGRLRRPPKILADHGLEWLGRLLIEPRRLWKRYLVGIPLFVWRVVRQRFWGFPD